MHDFYVRWGDDVQPYLMQLASEHIETLGRYCKNTILRLLRLRRARLAVILVTARVRRRMMNAKAFHCFKMFGFDFELREGSRKGRKLEFVLSFATTPDFEPKDMPPRLRRVNGQALSARPARKSRPQAVARPGAKTPKPRKARKGTRYRLACSDGPPPLIGKSGFTLATVSFLSAKLYKMDEIYRRLSPQLAAMWRRRPRIDLPFSKRSLLTHLRNFEGYTPMRACLEPQLLGESLRLLLFTFVPHEPPIDWSAYPFGRLADEGERIHA